MELNDFSSVFELLCGYNLVNAINSNSEILKVLDFTSPTKEGIADFKDRLKQKSNDLISGFRKNQDETNTESHESIDLKLQSVYAVRTSTDSLETKNNRHEKKASNLYLVAGIFCFF